MGTYSDEELIEQADSGNVEAMYKLHYRFDSEDEKASVEWLAKACDLEYAKAQYRMGELYAYGRGVRRNILTAIKWMRRSAENGDRRAEIFVKKYGIIADSMKSAKSGDPKAMAEVAAALMDKAIELEQNFGYRIADKDYKEAVRWATEAKKNDDSNAKACGVLGYAYYFGNAVGQDKDKAIRYLRKGERQNERRSLHRLGIEYLWGDRVKRDAHKGFSMIKEAAEQGYAPGMYDLARCYRYAIGTPGNLAKAVEWYIKEKEETWNHRLDDDIQELEMFDEVSHTLYVENYPERELNKYEAKTRWRFTDDLIQNLARLTVDEELEAAKTLIKKNKYDGLIDFAYSSCIPECIVNAIAPTGGVWWNDDKICSLSGLRVFCHGNKDEAITCFRDSFEKRWWRWVKFINTFYGSYSYDIEKGEPISVYETEYGFFVGVSVLRPECWGGMEADIKKCAEPIALALCDVIRNYQVRMIDGTINFETYDGKFNGNDSFSLFYNADLDAETEYEFVGQALSGELSKKDTFLWDFDFSLKEGKETIDLFLRYSGWITSEEMERMFTTLLDPKWQEWHCSGDGNELNEYVRYAKECYMRGEKPKHEESEPEKVEIEDYFNDFEAAIDMLALARKLEFVDMDSLAGMASLEEPFDKVIFAAEQGNVEAKFVAGKHLIADDIKKERKRAIRWIREAAGAGYEDAIKCIAKHPEVFSEG